MTGVAGAGEAGPGVRRGLLLYTAFALLCTAVYAPALAGDYVADDRHYLVTHPYTGSLALANLVELADPFGPARLHAVNYAPVHLFLCALERQVFGDWLPGYHLVNVLLHALNALLLMALLRSCAVPQSGALAGALLFALHPANVEAVAWMTQSKTLLAFALSWLALLLLWRRPGLASALFLLALLTKYLAVSMALMAVSLAWARPEVSRAARTWRWLGVWLALCIAVGIPQFDAFDAGGAVQVDAFEDPWVQLRTIAGLGARYLVMAATGYGVSAFHEPRPALSWTDPWWLLALPLSALLLWRLVVTVRRRSEEAAWWVCAGAAFAPISQVFPFFYPMGDRYLYFILPGLIGGALLAAAGLREGLASAVGRPGSSRVLARAGVVACLALAGLFTLHSASRAGLWRSEELLLLDAARNYPRGTSAHYVAAVRAAHEGDTERALEHLRAAEQGPRLSLVRPLAVDPRLAPIRQAPEFQAFVREIAGYRIELARRLDYDTPEWLRSVASAHEVRGEYDQAIAALERALRAGGPLRSELLVDLERVRRRRREDARAAAGTRQGS